PMKRIGVYALAQILVVSTAVVPLRANAQRVESRPFVIHAIPAPVGEQTAKPGEPLLVQPATTPEGARLDEATHSYSRIFVGTHTVPAGTLLFSSPSFGGILFCESSRAGYYGSLV